jgi:germination protein M
MTPPMPRRALLTALLGLAAALVAWLVFVAIFRRPGGPAAAAPPGSAATASAASATGPAPAGRKIKARLFYASDDGTSLTGVERDVPYGEGTGEQAKALVTAQLAPPADPLLSAVPAGTTLRALFVTEDGTAYVDLSHEVATAHGGGSLDELLTVYAIVDALTANLPAISAVQLLVDGQEVDTLAGHVDLGRPLAKNLEIVK